MVSSIDLTFAGIFIIELENMLVPKLRQHMQNWRRYEDVNLAYMKNVLSVLETEELPQKRKLITLYHF